MSLLDLGARVERSLRRSAGLLQELLDGLARRRGTWLSARPHEVPADGLDRLAAELAAEQDQRSGLLGAAAELLPAGPAARHSRQVLAGLGRALPPAPAARLREASAAAAAAAHRLRVELALGERLLQFAQRAHDGLLGGIARDLGARCDDVGGYDHRARRVRGPLVGGAPPTGNLIDGRM